MTQIEKEEIKKDVDEKLVNEDKKGEKEDEKEKEFNPEEEVVEGNWKIVDIPLVEVDNGEKEEEELFSARAKLYRFDNEEWKERGVGNFRILKNKNSQRRRAILRQDQIFKFRCHFWITGNKLCQLKKLPTAEKSYYWNCIDYSDNEMKFQRFCIRFKTEEESNKFKETFESSYLENEKLNWKE